MTFLDTFRTLAVLMIGTVYSGVLALFVILAQSPRLEGLPIVAVALLIVVPGAWLTTMALRGVRACENR